MASAEGGIIRDSRYLIRVDGHAVVADHSQEARIRALTPEQRERFHRIMGHRT